VDKSDYSADKLAAVISLASTVIILFGAVFPIYQFVFTPPHGYLVVDGTNLYAFNQSFAIISPLPGTEEFTHAMRSGLFGLIIGNILQDLPTVLTNNEGLLAFLGNRIVQILFGAFAAFAVLVQTVALLGVLALFIALPNLEGFSTISPSEYVALQYFHPSFGFGGYVVIIGFVTALLLAIRNVGWRLGAGLLVLSIVLFFCSGSLGPVTAFYEFLDRLDPLQFIGL
jgi:hypothetical protein